MPNQKLLHALNDLGALPPIPRIAREILALKMATDEGERELLELIDTDPPILSRIIGLANSPLFGTGRRIVALRDAVPLLGSKRVKMSALGFAMLSSLTRKPAGQLNVQGLWQHSLAVAMAMDTVARQMPAARRPPEDEIYLAGLVHDIGFLALDYLDPQLSDKFHARLAAEPDCPVEEAEAEMLGISHGQMGAALGRHWNLPTSIVTVMNYHHAPADERAAAAHPLVSMAALAHRLLPAFFAAEPGVGGIAAEEWQALGIDPFSADDIRAMAQEHVRQVAALET